MSDMPLAAASSHSSGDGSARLALGVGVPLAILVLAYVPFLLLRSELPTRVASHFDVSGRPDGSMTVASFLLVTGGFIVVGIGACIVTAVRRPAEGGLAATGGFLGGFLGGLGAAILASTSVAQRGLTDWREASGAGWMLIGVLAIATALGVLGALFATRLDTGVADVSSASAPVLDLADGEVAVWAASSRSTSLLVVGICGLIVGVVIAAAASWSAGLIAVVGAMLMLTLSTVRVRADHTGLRVGYGLLPWPATKVPISRLERATVIDVRPMEWGGWGYRGSLKLMRRAAVVHRAGPGIRCDLIDGRTFVVTIDDPDGAVALLNAEVERRSSAVV